MTTSPAIARELLSAPLPEIIERLGSSIADAQRALDENAIRAAALMATEQVEIGGERHNLLALGFGPTFYSFTEATVEAKLSFSMSETTEFGITAGLDVGVTAKFVMVAASVSVSYARKFSVSADGMSSIAARLVSLPPPAPFETVLRRLVAPSD